MATYIRLTDYRSSDEKEQEFFNPENRYETKQEYFSKIPASPIIYWFKDKIIDTFNGSLLKDIPIYTGMATSDNGRFLRFWHETEKQNINFNANSIDDTFSGYKWYTYNKGGSVRKWYGNFEYVVNFKDDGKEIKDEVNRKYPYLKGNTGFYIRYQDHYFKQGLTWSAVSSGMFAVRLHSKNSIFSNAGFVAIPENDLLYYMSLLNSSFSFYVISALAQTINNNASDIEKLPVLFPEQDSIKQKIETLTQQNINISKEEWDSRETSWDFRINELIRMKSEELRVKSCRIEDAYNAYCDYWREKFFTLHRNEEELNRFFIDIYELQDELTPDVPLEDITILKNEAKIEDGELVFQADEIMKQFISYGVGVMFGRYSLDHEGLHIADMGVSLEEANARFHIQNPSFEADDDNVIPVVDEADYFADDMTERFEHFVAVAFGQEYLHENIAFIENAIGKKLRKYFVKDFYKDHIKRYKKRPIYWMFASPKGLFQTLIYMHRYTPDILNQILNDYLRPFRIRLESMRSDLMRISESVDTVATERNLAERKIDKIDQTLDDINAYEKVLAHYAAQDIVIDLDDGVKVNYCKFKELTVPFDKKMCK